MAPRDSGTTHVAFGAHDGLGLHNVVISWLNPIPHAITVYASDPALPQYVANQRCPYLAPARVVLEIVLPTEVGRSVSSAAQTPVS